MTLARKARGVSHSCVCERVRITRSKELSTPHPRDVNVYRTMIELAIIAILTAMALQARSQALFSMSDCSGANGVIAPAALGLTYGRPRQTTKVFDYGFDARVGDPFGVAKTRSDPWVFTSVQRSKHFGNKASLDSTWFAIGTSTRYDLAERFSGAGFDFRYACDSLFARRSPAVGWAFEDDPSFEIRPVSSFWSITVPSARATSSAYAQDQPTIDPIHAFWLESHRLFGHITGNFPVKIFYTAPHALFSRIRLNNSLHAPMGGANSVSDSGIGRERSIIALPH